jgi:hypothetical protein
MVIDPAQDPSAILPVVSETAHTVMSSFGPMLVFGYANEFH